MLPHLETKKRLGMTRFIVIERGTGRVYGGARDGEAQALAYEKGSLVASLVSYNS